MTIEVIFVLFVILVMVLCLAFEVARADMIVLFFLSLLFISGTISSEEALQGFSNEGMLTIALLFIIGGAVKKSGIIYLFIQFISKDKEDYKKMYGPLMLPISGLSAFFNNTPIVVMLTPVLKKWCEEKGISPSKLLIPLSYATIFGGMITIIGTSTNLIIHGLMIENGMNGFSMFHLAAVGIPGALLAYFYVRIIGHKLLPERKTSQLKISENTREYLAEAIVEKGSPFSGQTVKEAKLRDLSGLFLIEIIRQKKRIAPVSSDMTLMESDRLIFTGDASKIVDLQKKKGFKLEIGLKTKLDDLNKENVVLREIVITPHSSLLWKKIKHTDFRKRFDSAIVAVHRKGSRVKGKVGNIKLQPGDVLLILCQKGFSKKHINSEDFYPISSAADYRVTDNKRSKIAILSLLLMVLLTITGILSLLKSAILAVIILLVGKTISIEEARKSINFSVLFLIVGSIGIGKAFEVSGASSVVANGILHVIDPFGYIGALIAIYLMTNILTEIITNNAAAVVMFPIAIDVSQLMNVDSLPLLTTLAIAASASFSTPIGYQTNLIVYGPGGYKFTDYFKIGFPLSIIFMVMSISIVYFIF